MQFSTLLTTLSFISLLGSVSCLYSPPAGSITVGKGGKYPTLTEALKDTSSNKFFVYAGNYTEAVVIDRPNITIYGQSPYTNTYVGNKATFSRNMPATIAGSNDKSSTISVAAVGVSIYNLNIENTYGKPVDQSQAIALSVQNGQFACYGCQIRGYQDTLLANKGTQFYSKCLIQGSVDFVFGQHALVFITQSTIRTIGDGYITASGRSEPDDGHFVIDRSIIKGYGKQYLGRPWKTFARVTFQKSYISSHVVPEGWSNWVDSSPTNNLQFGESGNVGAGAWNPKRVSFAHQVAPVSIDTLFGKHEWIDPGFL